MFVDITSPFSVTWYTTNLPLGTISNVAVNVIVKLLLFGMSFLADRINFPREESK